MPTVLIVEDDPLNLRVFSKILSKGGNLKVRSTEDPEEVLCLARSAEIDAILMDVSLTHSTYQGQAVDGIKITQILKADPKTAALPVILLTAHALESDRDSFLKQSHADDYITKPITDPQQFIAQVRQWTVSR